jgi:hypothetical protein
MEYSFLLFSLICFVGVGLWEWFVGHLGSVLGWLAASVASTYYLFFALFIPIQLLMVKKRSEDLKSKNE